MQIVQNRRQIQSHRRTLATVKLIECSLCQLTFSRIRWTDIWMFSRLGYYLSSVSELISAAEKKTLNIYSLFSANNLVRQILQWDLEWKRNDKKILVFPSFECASIFSSFLLATVLVDEYTFTLMSQIDQI